MNIGVDMMQSLIQQLFIEDLSVPGAFLVAQPVKNLPAMQETQVQSLHAKDALEKGMATHSSILAWRITWTEEPGSPWSHKELDMTEQLTLLLFF